jgi:hypothetical protein
VNATGQPLYALDRLPEISVAFLGLEVTRGLKPMPTSSNAQTYLEKIVSQ